MEGDYEGWPPTQHTSLSTCGYNWAAYCLGLQPGNVMSRDSLFCQTKMSLHSWPLCSCCPVVRRSPQPGFASLRSSKASFTKPSSFLSPLTQHTPSLAIVCEGSNDTAVSQLHHCLLLPHRKNSQTPQADLRQAARPHRNHTAGVGGRPGLPAFL